MVIVLRKRALAIAALCVAVLIAVPFLVRMAVPKTAAVSAANTNWGLSFQENGKTPTGNATPEFLKQYGAYLSARPRRAARRANRKRSI